MVQKKKENSTMGSGGYGSLPIKKVRITEIRPQILENEVYENSVLGFKMNSKHSYDIIIFFFVLENVIHAAEPNLPQFFVC